MLIIDNWSVHVVSKVNEFWIKKHIRILIIDSNCLSLNPIEKLILNIKSKICSFFLKEKLQFENSIDETGDWDLSGFVRASNKEVLCKMKDLAKIYLKMLKIKVDKQLNQLSYLQMNFDVFLITD